MGMTANDADKFIEGLDNEVDAFRVLHAMRNKFDWAGTMFSVGDVHSALLTDHFDGDNGEGDDTYEGIDDDIDTIVNSRTWRKFMEEWMCEQGWEIIQNAISDMKYDKTMKVEEG